MDVESNVEEVDEVTRLLTVKIPAGDVAKEVDVELSRLSKQVRLKGFRPGKAPKNLVEKQHGARVRLEVAHRMISGTLKDIVEKHSLDMVGDPDIDIASPLEPGQELEYKASISLFPTPEIKGYDSFTVEVPKKEVTDADVDEALEKIRESKATPQKVEFRTKAQKGDVIDASLEMIVDGEKPERPEPLVVAIGENALPAELEEGLIGMEIGETKEIKGKVPHQHDHDHSDGEECCDHVDQEAIYKVVLNGLSEKVLPELNDEFAKSSGHEVETLLELRLKVREQLEAQADEGAKADVHVAILDQILDANEFLVPQIMVDNEIRNLLIRTGLVNPQQMDPAKIPVEAFRENLGETAAKRVRTSVVVDRVAEIEKLQASQEELTTAMQELADANGIPLDEVKNYFLDQGRAINFALEQTRNKVLEFLEGRANVTFVEPKEESEDPKEDSSSDEKKAE
jgi:trigger factor